VIPPIGVKEVVLNASTRLSLDQLHTIDTIGEVPEEATTSIGIAYHRNARITSIFGNKMIKFLTSEKTPTQDKLKRNDRVRLKDDTILGTIDERAKGSPTCLVTWDDGLTSEEMMEDVEPANNKMSWDAWKVRSMINMGEAFRFRVDRPKHTGYITIKYLSNLDPSPDSPGNQFEVEFAVLDGTEYKVVTHEPRVHRDDLVRTIAQRIT